MIYEKPDLGRFLTACELFHEFGEMVLELSPRAWSCDFYEAVGALPEYESMTAPFRAISQPAVSVLADRKSNIRKRSAECSNHRNRLVLRAEGPC